MVTRTRYQTSYGAAAFFDAHPARLRGVSIEAAPTRVLTLLTRRILKRMRIGTWNLDGGSSAAHVEFLVAQQCDIWLLTEVAEAFAMPGGHIARSKTMGGKKDWAAVWSSKSLEQQDSADEHSAVALVDGALVCSCVLPWRGGLKRWPGQPPNLASATTAALALLATDLAGQSNVVWGGDWNHALQGVEYVGSYPGRSAIQALAGELGLQTPTANLPHWRDGMSSIDHVAVPDRWTARPEHRPAARNLSDHDCYVVDVD
jgi:hypothetical protein